MTAAALLDQARSRGLRLEARGDKLAVIPARLCPADFAALLREHKGELIGLLTPKAPPFELTDRHVIRPGDRIPRGLLPVLASWKALRVHPAWQHAEWPPIAPTLRWKASGTRGA